jgi:hypothetical protein
MTIDEAQAKVANAAEREQRAKYDATVAPEN